MPVPGSPVGPVGRSGPGRVDGGRTDVGGPARLVGTWSHEDMWNSTGVARAVPTRAAALRCAAALCAFERAAALRCAAALCAFERAAALRCAAALCALAGCAYDAPPSPWGAVSTARAGGPGHNPVNRARCAR